MKKIVPVIAALLATVLLQSFSQATPLNAPSLMTTTNGNQVTASWTAVPGALNYMVYFAPPDQTGQPDLAQVGYFSWNGTQVGPVTFPTDFSLYLAVQDITASGGGTLSNISFFSLQPAPVPTGTVKVLGANDLGMHCVDKDFSIFSILPPYNVLNAQVVLLNPQGSPTILDGTTVELKYGAVADPSGSINSTSINKANFWQFAQALFGAQLLPGEGLKGLFMPMDDLQNLGPQPIPYNGLRGYFAGEGIPLFPWNDQLIHNSYPLMRMSAFDKTTGQLLGRTDVVLPISDETDCQGCHVTGGIASQRAGITWANDSDLEIQTSKNILLLHDVDHGTSLQNATPVLCAQCHYSLALDLAGSGPQGDQVGNLTFSHVMHAFHGQLLDSQGGPLFPAGGTLEQTCYQCHPGKITQCQRGAMKTGGIGCHDCHGDLLAVGGINPLLAGGSIDGKNDGGARRPWQDLPRCQACHTGDAVSNLTGGSNLVPAGDGIRLRQAYRTGDPSASPLLAANTRFAENADTLYRFSKGHGRILCEGCHGSTHAEWPNASATANDNITATELQGHTGPITECSTCHTQGTLSRRTLGGPHGLHRVNDAGWISAHGDLVENSSSPLRAECRACHGLTLDGTVLSRAAADRTLARGEDGGGGTVSVSKNQPISCTLCHSKPF
jgi:hypothetical protein